MQLDVLQRELEERYEQLSGERTDNRRIFALEHGQTIDTEKLSAALSKELTYGKPDQDHWLVWVVFATEIGYSFAGAEYWQTFNERMPAWHQSAHNIRNRNLIRVWFRRFARKYNGVRPSGTWASQFSIIAWPITHAILPKDLQFQFAKSLHHHRYRLAADNDPISIGGMIHRQVLPTSSRFREFSEQEELAGRIALALLGVESGELPLSPEATKRIVGDLEATQAAKDWLQKAREIRQIRGTKKPGQSDLRPQERQQSSEAKPKLRTPLLLSKANSAWKVGVLIPSLAPLVADIADVGQFLKATKVQLQGGSGSWQPAQILTGKSKLYMLQQWPKDGVVVQFKDPHPILEHLLRQDGALSKGPLWVCKIGSDGLAREIIHHQLRPGQEYIVLSQAGHALPPCQQLEPVDVQCAGVVGFRLSLPTHVPEDIRRPLKSLGLTITSTVRIWPAGVPAISWDGEGLSEWLTTDLPCFGIGVDGEVEAVEVALNGNTRLTIPRRGVTGPSWLQLPPLPPGQHLLTVEARGGGKEGQKSGATIGEVLLNVRDPLSLEQMLSQRGGLMAIPTPADATLDDFETGRLTLDLFGPKGRTVDLFLEMKGVEPSRAALGKVDLPATVTGLSGKLSTDAEEVLGVSSSCRLVVTAEEIGSFSLPLERVNRPVRWLLKRSKRAVSLRLVDEAGLGPSAICQMAPLEAPSAPKALDYHECLAGVDIPAPGGLYVVAGKGRMDAVIVGLLNQQGKGDLASLSGVEPRLDGYAASAATLKNDAQLLTLWAKARAIGSLGSQRQKKVVRAMRGALIRLVCGVSWAHAETKFEASDKGEDAIANLGDAISMSSARRSFAAKLRMSHKEANEKTLPEMVSWLLPISSAFGICSDRSAIEKALRFITDIPGFVASSPDVEEDVRDLSTNADLVRGIRYLQILLGEKSWV